MVTTGQIFRVLLAPLNFFPLKLAGVNTLQCLGWLHGRVETGSEHRRLSGNASQRADSALTRESGGEQTECHQKAIPLKTFFKKQTNKQKTIFITCDPLMFISAFIIYNCPKKFYNSIT